MLEKYKNIQSDFYDYFNYCMKKNKISHAYLIESNDVTYAYDLVLDLAKFLFCSGKYDDKICDLIDNGNYPNLKIIGGTTGVKKDEIISLKYNFSMKSFDNNKLIYIIRDVENINKYAANSLLKFLEEPSSNVVAILLCSNVSDVLPTLSSRSQVISLVSDDGYNNIFKSMYEKLESNLSFDEFVSEYSDKFWKFYIDYEKNGCLIMIDSEFYQFTSCIKELLLFGLYMYFDVARAIFSLDIKHIDQRFSLEKIVENNSFDDIMKKINVINTFIFNFKYNVNVNLFLDNFVISLGGAFDERGYRG